MKASQRLRSFTILEVLITLIILGIIINLTYSIYTLMSKQMMAYQEQNTTLLNYNLLNSTLRRDIENANNIKVEENNLILTYYNNQPVKYKVVQSQLIREVSNATDTFDITIKDYKIIQKKDGTYLYLEFVLLHKTVVGYYYKDKSIETVINQMFLDEDRY